VTSCLPLDLATGALLLWLGLGLLGFLLGGWPALPLSRVAALALAATSATLGMPMIVELGIALDALIGFIILGVFFFQMRETFDSMDLQHLEQIREE
jgi:hypothetical protein